MGEGRCRWVRHKDVPGGKYHLPGCYAGAMTEGQQCHCPSNGPSRIDLLELRIERLEARLATPTQEGPNP